MNNFSNKSTEEIKEISEDFSEIFTKLDESYDKLAEIHSEHRLNMKVFHCLTAIADALASLNCLQEELADSVKETHTLTDSELELLSFG